LLSDRHKDRRLTWIGGAGTPTQRTRSSVTERGEQLEREHPNFFVWNGNLSKIRGRRGGFAGPREENVLGRVSVAERWRDEKRFRVGGKSRKF